MAQQLDHERRIIGDTSTMTLLKEMWLIPSNRKRAIISVALMIAQQLTGVNAVVSTFPGPLGAFLALLQWCETAFLEPLAREIRSLTRTELLRPPDFQGPRPGRRPGLPPRDGRLRNRQGGGLPLLPALRCGLARQEAQSPLDERGAGGRHVHRWNLRAGAAADRGEPGKFWSRPDSPSQVADVTGRLLDSESSPWPAFTSGPCSSSSAGDRAAGFSSGTLLGPGP